MAMVLLVLSGECRGQRLPIPPDGEVVFGAASDADVVLSGGAVSPRHARMVSRADGVTVEDLGSHSGVHVNGHRVTRSPVVLGDRVLIGAHILILEDDTRRGVDSLPRGTNDIPSRGVVSGRIEELPLPDALQLLSVRESSGVLEVRAPEGRARIWFRAGRICFAALDAESGLAPREALYRALEWRRGEFRFAPGASETVSEEMLATKVEMLLAEWIIRRDANAGDDDGAGGERKGCR